MRSPVQSVEVSYLVHSTEDVAIIASAVEKAIGARPEARVTELEGYYGNRILHVSYFLTGEEAASAFSSLTAMLSREEKTRILGELGSLMDEHSALYLRLNKGELVSGKGSLGTGETVRVKVKPRLFQMSGGAEEFYRRALEGGL